MIKLKVDNEFLDTKGDLKIPVEFNKDIFNFEVLKTSRTFTFTLPKTPKNYRKLKFNYASNFISSQEVACSIYSDTHKIAEGNIKPVAFNEKGINAKINFDLYTILDTGVQTLLTDLLPNYASSFDGISLAENKNAIFPARDYCAPTMHYDISTVNMTGITTFNSLTTIEVIEGVFVETYIDYNEPGYEEKMFMPYFFLGFVVHSVFRHFGYNIGESVFNTVGWLRKLHLIHNYPNKNWTNYKKMTFAERVPPISVTDFLKEITKTFNLDFSLNSASGTINIALKSDLKNKKKGYYSVSNLEMKPFDFKKSINYVNLSNEQTNETLTNDYPGTQDKEITYNYDYYTVRVSGHKTISDKITDSQYFKYLILGFYEYNTIPDSINEIDGVSLVLNSNHIFFHTLNKTIRLINSTLEEGEATITVDPLFVQHISDMACIEYDNKVYFIKKTTGYITGSKYIELKAELIKI